MSIFDNYQNLSQDEKIKFNKKLVKRYPFLVPKNAWTGKTDDDYDYTWTEADNIPNGWLVAFGEMFLEELREELVKYDYLEKYQVVQIKEKYGSLRFYDAGYPKDSKIPDIIGKYSCLSENICIVCGKPDVPTVSDYWISPYCKDCWTKMERNCLRGQLTVTDEEINEKYDNLTAGSQQELSTVYGYTRFSRGKTEKVEIDISDTADKIRKLYKDRAYGSDRGKK